MYMTLKLRFKMNRETKKYLLAYETAYHNEILKLSNQLRKGERQIQKLNFSTYFHPDARWQLYKLALKYEQADRCQRKICYSRSSSWGGKAFRIMNNKINLFFGISFPVEMLAITIYANELELNRLQKGKLIRVDIVHDEKFWFGNFIIKYKDE